MHMEKLPSWYHPGFRPHHQTQVPDVGVTMAPQQARMAMGWEVWPDVLTFLVHTSHTVSIRGLPVRRRPLAQGCWNMW